MSIFHANTYLIDMGSKLWSAKAMKFNVHDSLVFSNLVTIIQTQGIATMNVKFANTYIPYGSKFSWSKNFVKTPNLLKS